MAKKKKQYRHNAKPDIIASHGESKIAIWLLADGDSVSVRSSTNYDHRSTGPGMFIEETSPNGTRKSECYLNDTDTNLWLSRLITAGLQWYAGADWASRDVMDAQVDAGLEAEGERQPIENLANSI